MTRATIILAFMLPLLGGCVSSNDKGSELASTPSPRRYDTDRDLDQPKRVCEDSLVGGQPKTVCY